MDTNINYGYGDKLFAYLNEKGGAVDPYALKSKLRKAELDLAKVLGKNALLELEIDDLKRSKDAQKLLTDKNKITKLENRNRELQATVNKLQNLLSIHGVGIAAIENESGKYLEPTNH